MTPSSSDDLPVLVATWRGRELVRISASDVPSEVSPESDLDGDAPALFVLRDRRGREMRYNLESVRGEGYRKIYFSVRVHDSFAVQADCLVSRNDVSPPEAFRTGEADGIRFQPLCLPEFRGDPPDVTGRGLFVRGFHFPGSVTPGNVTHIGICDDCRESFRFHSFHAGFSSSLYFYCESGLHTLVAHEGVADMPSLLSAPNGEALVRFESKLPPCERCSTAFRYLNPFRCPHCRSPYIDFLRHPDERPREYYGNYHYGLVPQVLRAERV